MASHPLISTIVTLYTIILLYFPAIAASPLIISTSVLLLSLLRLGAAQRISQENKKPEPQVPSLQVTPDFAYHHDCTNFKKDQGPEPVLDPVPIGFHDDCLVVVSNNEKDSVFEAEERPFYGECFVEWNVRAPLEVIYEAYEGEEEEDEGTEEKRKEAFGVIERYASLSMYYPETDTDTDTSSDDGGSPVVGNWDDSPENVCFPWQEENEELIEIELDSKRNSQVEEENLIEIDLSFSAR
ncbi:uncharacterized protein LOC132046154 [Lycium ferocissimum]|uniref:uncharacterized protein LOC132046154 n=1 Tax=Lycium ferocissimum TaxID=112874 RepID=UPI0028149839|nr:uncharacterized protein LOC132046154 [Lycium ferocissimum]